MTRSRKHFTAFKPHSQHKQLILKTYFEAWERKLLLRPGAGTVVCYVDACAGRGIDDAGQHGSPIIAAKAEAMSALSQDPSANEGAIALRAASEMAKLIVPSGLAWLGALFGARWALSRYKNERAFDRRLDWYERVVRRLGVLRGNVFAAASLVRSGRDDMLPSLTRALEDGRDELRATVAEAMLYG